MILDIIMLDMAFDVSKYPFHNIEKMDYMDKCSGHALHIGPILILLLIRQNKECKSLFSLKQMHNLILDIKVDHATKCPQVLAFMLQTIPKYKRLWLKKSFARSKSRWELYTYQRPLCARAIVIPVSPKKEFVNCLWAIEVDFFNAKDWVVNVVRAASHHGCPR